MIGLSSHVGIAREPRRWAFGHCANCFVVDDKNSTSALSPSPALAKQLGCDEKDVRRMLDPRHSSRITALQAALSALGKKTVVSVDNAA